MATATFAPNNVSASTGVYLSAALAEVVVEGALHVEVHGAGAYTAPVDNTGAPTTDWTPAPVGPVDLAAGERRAWRWMGGASQVPLRVARP
jgi:hypothetical protein